MNSVHTPPTLGIKHALLCVTLAIVSLPLVAKKDKDSVLDSINQRTAYIAKQVNILNEKQKCTTVITQKDVGTTGYVITEPGDYCLGEDIVFAPENPASFVPVTFTGGGGSSAAGFALVSDSIVHGVAMTNGGKGYLSAPTAIFGGTGSGAAGYGGFSIASLSITNPGSNYGFPIVVITGDGHGAQAVATADPITGAITSITLLNAGFGYTTATVTISDDLETGSGATATATLGTTVTGVNVTAGGSGYQNTVQAAITVNAAPVNLQLNNHRLSQVGGTTGADFPNYAGINSPSTQVPYVVGILVPDTLPTDTNVNDIGLASIYISGDQGIIDGFSLYGIRVFGHTADIRISNLTIGNIGLLGTYYLRPFAGYLPNGCPGYVNINVGDFATQTPGTTSGTEMGIAALCIGEGDVFGMGPQFFTQNTGAFDSVGYFGTPQNRVNSVVLDTVSCLNNFFMGLCVSNITNLYTINCHFDGTLTDDPNLLVTGASFGPAIVRGENPNILNAVVEQSTFNNTRALGDYMTEEGISGTGTVPPEFVGGCVGVFPAFCQNLAFSACNFDHTTMTFASDEAAGGADLLVDALYTGPLTDCTFDQCSFSDVNNLWNAVGISFTVYDQYFTTIPSHNVQLSNFTVSNIQSNNQNLDLPVIPSADNVVFGIYMSGGMENFTAENGVISDIIINGPATGATFYGAAGLYMDTLDNGVFRNITVQRVITLQGGPVVGIEAASSLTGQSSLIGVSFENCIIEGCISSTPTAPYVNPPYNATRSCATGIFLDLLSIGEYPVSLSGCKALHNKGVPFDATNAGTIFGAVYSAGFSAQCTSTPITKISMVDCEAIDNVYGFLLQNAAPCVVRNCRSDLNVSDDGTNTGEGFTDLGLSTTSTPSGVAQSFSLFESNKAFENGAGNTHFGENGNYNVIYGSGADMDYVPTLTGNLTYPTALGGSFFPQANYIAHNLSITQS